MIFRSVKDKNNPYVMLNKCILNDERISWKAKGILATLLSRPDDWRFYELELITHATDGRDSTRAGINELIQAGYIVRGERKRDDLGRLKEYEYYVYESPHCVTVSSKDGFSYVGESNTTNKDFTETDDIPIVEHGCADAQDRGRKNQEEMGM